MNTAHGEGDNDLEALLTAVTLALVASSNADPNKVAVLLNAAAQSGMCLS